ncbi:hypothetical protein RchiOBHm_Chr1g0344671 [Rosa chinensis]|uniref:Secreted protein n=1 Tax=Rosa chinensis TaxID=74649 RepID=A0A2P6SEK1_ROSCH|nr:hypothetical protein RchiOBHm_Chr1g0344671 [Rosa chinensis]
MQKGVHIVKLLLFLCASFTVIPVSCSYSVIMCLEVLFCLDFLHCNHDDVACSNVCRMIQIQKKRIQNTHTHSLSLSLSLRFLSIPCSPQYLMLS